MAHLIIGHTSERSARIWVRGDIFRSACRVCVESDNAKRAKKHIRLRRRDDYTGVVEFGDLKPGTPYSVTAMFSPLRAKAVGSFTTFALSNDGSPVQFSFILSSCNLSVVSIDNFLAFLLAVAGTSVGRTALDLPVRRWRHPSFFWLWAVLRMPLRLLLKATAGLVYICTGLKQPGTPSIRSPFLKLAAVFDPWILEIKTSMENLPAVGDLVSTPATDGASEATAVVAARGPAENGKQAGTVPSGTVVPCRLVLAHVQGTFERDRELYAQAQGRLGIRTTRGAEVALVGRVADVWQGKAWYEPCPSFVLHAGDQIYYDFPTLARAPRRQDYRIAYREAWFEDEAARYVLANYPNYMTLDDHEIANQFARDFHPPKDGVSSNVYREEALAVYREYTHALAPMPATGEGPRSESFSYQFEKGSCGFFVLDTRTQRLDRAAANDRPSPRMIDPAQMTRLLNWLKHDGHSVKFVVTSVPFVAEVKEAPVAGPAPPSDWFSRPARGESAPVAAARTSKGNSEQDKWSAQRFRVQREQIIEHIHRHRIERVVFLTGDMHCCYHATMRIGGDTPYTSTTIHELAGGPVNQLDLSRVDDFITRHTGRTDSGVRYDVVLDRFHGAASAVLYIQVNYEHREPVLSSEQEWVPELKWHVIRTLTDANPLAWSRKVPGGAQPETVPADATEHVMSGRISFVRQRRTDDLRRWHDTR
jgi:PhoD-like phosphatase